MRACLMVGLLLWSGFTLVKGSDSGLALFEGLCFLGSGLAMGLGWPFAVRHLFRREPYRPEAWSRCLAYSVAGPMLIAAVLGVWMSGTAFRVRFELSAGALERYVQALPPNPGEADLGRVGLLEVREAEVLPGGVVRLITSDDRFLDHAGVVYSREGAPPYVAEDRYEHIRGPWWHWRRSW